MQQSNGLFLTFTWKPLSSNKQQIKCNKCSNFFSNYSGFRKHCISCKLQKELILQTLSKYEISELNEKSVNFVLCMSPNLFYSSNKPFAEIIKKNSHYHADWLKKHPALISVKPNACEHGCVPFVPQTSPLKKLKSPLRKSVRICQKPRRFSDTDFANTSLPAPKKFKKTDNYEQKQNIHSKKMIKNSQISDSVIQIPCDDSSLLPDINDIGLLEGSNFGFVDDELAFPDSNHQFKIPLKEMRLETVVVVPSCHFQNQK